MKSALPASTSEIFGVDPGSPVLELNRVKAIRMDKQSEELALLGRLQFLKNAVRQEERIREEARRRELAMNETLRFKEKREKLREQTRRKNEIESSGKMEKVSRERSQLKATVRAAEATLASEREENAAVIREESKKLRAQRKTEHDNYVRQSHEITLKIASSRLRRQEMKKVDERTRHQRTEERILSQVAVEDTKCRELNAKILALRGEERRLLTQLARSQAGRQQQEKFIRSNTESRVGTSKHLLESPSALTDAASLNVKSKSSVSRQAKNCDGKREKEVEIANSSDSFVSPASSSRAKARAPPDANLVGKHLVRRRAKDGDPGMVRGTGLAQTRVRTPPRQQQRRRKSKVKSEKGERNKSVAGREEKRNRTNPGGGERNGAQVVAKNVVADAFTFGFLDDDDII
mmetsp:Transcript_24946/g.34694  ORF Transcript_24946/g.34694 Transcript_24946/m.34694 type:complete len:407 (+) Transcript_24946:121-1341(+)|eukprot:CAMPEP_0184490226 /NCGR_PEP_ID=MMETSP0113_2-20130426/17327_1 /TAXON_ID=91329 /ORGANISM="Norrisiella sphaerica, Strain BC52" /LENGTH=406 /DNA_ID=CAMNT_0026874009 /DNA_START=82 /DNA_END=1302 /DNA_ORIENTATION=+